MELSGGWTWCNRTPSTLQTLHLLVIKLRFIIIMHYCVIRLNHTTHTHLPTCTSEEFVYGAGKCDKSEK